MSRKEESEIIKNEINSAKDTFKSLKQLLNIYLTNWKWNFLMKLIMTLEITLSQYF